MKLDACYIFKNIACIINNNILIMTPEEALEYGMIDKVVSRDAIK